ncbi:MAG: carboxypeptidase regulatory-like domain-containing protein [Nitrososphaerales archaeon]
MESSQDRSAQENQTAQTTVEKPEVIVQKMAEGSVDGQVACIDGPVLNATVSIGMISTYSDAKGNFLIEHVPPGIGKIRVKPPVSRFYDYTQDILIEADKRKNLFIFLTEITGTVEGTIAEANGKFIVGAEVSGLFRLAKDALISKTDEKGHFVFAEVPRGAYYIRAKAQGFMTEGATVTVTGGSNIVSNFTLKPGNLSITGKVTNKEGTPIESEIYLYRSGIVVTKLTTTKGDGTFVFADLVSDRYEIGTLAAGYMGKGWFGKLEKSEVVNFELDPSPESQNVASDSH